jgi:hypothetical protein
MKAAEGDWKGSEAKWPRLFDHAMYKAVQEEFTRMDEMFIANQSDL